MIYGLLLVGIRCPSDLERSFLQGGVVFACYMRFFSADLLFLKTIRNPILGFVYH